MTIKSNINFLTIGAQKAGTSWLDFSLRKHPDVWLPPIKELHYFDTKHSIYSARREDAFNALKAIINYHSSRKNLKDANLNHKLMTLSKLAFENYTDEMYLSIFEGVTSKVVGEITPGYSALPEAGVSDISQVLGDVKIIYMLRHPVARAWSAFRMNINRGRLSKTLSLCLDSDKTSDSSQLIYEAITDPKCLSYLDSRTNYQQTSSLYEKYFTHVHYIIYDDLCREPLSVLKGVCDFLGIEFKESAFQDDANQRRNQGIKLEMPDLVQEFLAARYVDQEVFVREKFRLRLDQFQL